MRFRVPRGVGALSSKTEVDKNSVHSAQPASALELFFYITLQAKGLRVLLVNPLYVVRLCQVL